MMDVVKRLRNSSETRHCPKRGMSNVMTLLLQYNQGYNPSKMGLMRPLEFVFHWSSVKKVYSDKSWFYDASLVGRRFSMT